MRNVPLSFVAAKIGGAAAKSVNIEIPLIPFIDLQICLVVFLLMSFSSTGELVTQRPNLRVPKATNAKTLEVAPVIAIDPAVVLLDGRRMADTSTLAADAKIERIEPLIADLEVMKRNWSILHPQGDFPGELILQADTAIDYRVIKKVMFSAGLAGYPKVTFAVQRVGGNP